MEKISMKEFVIWQPGFPQESETDKFYLAVANKLLSIIEGSYNATIVPDELKRRIALSLTGYFQDIIADAGIWRSFTKCNWELYGKPIPFYDCGDEYVDYELNRVDIRFLIWYLIAMISERHRDINPHTEFIIALADQCFEFLDSIYEEAPTPMGYNFAMEYSLEDSEDRETIYHISNWLFMHCYLMTPAFALTLSMLLNDHKKQKTKDIAKLHNQIDKAMTEEPTGPLALYLSEWLNLIFNNEIPNFKKFNKNPINIHKYYTAFKKATGGKVIAYFKTYKQLNEFLIVKMNWENGVEHLPMMKNFSDFVILVNPERGMLISKGTAACIKDPDNPYYDEKYAKENAFNMLSIRGFCPADLTIYCIENGFLPDAHFPNSQDYNLVKENADFIMRCYLQQYYRD